MSNPTRNDTYASLTGVLTFASFSAIDTYCSYRAYRSDGDEIWLWCRIIPFSGLLLAFTLLLVLSTVGLFFKKLRAAARLGFVCLLASFVSCATIPLAGFVGATIPLGDGFRQRGMATIAANGEPILKAIEAYRSRHGAWPANLEVLVPEFLPAVPATGLGAFPAFEYVVGSKAETYYSGNPWVLQVSTPIGAFNWDVFKYYPLQNYPDTDHGDWLERMGTWAYVHE